MAYGEKRGTGPTPWRARYKKPDGSLGSEPGFRTKVLARDWGNDQEAQIRAGTWIDPDLMRVHFGVFARRFMAERQKRGRTMATRWDLLDGFILPKWQHTPLIGLSWFDVDGWSMTLPCDDTKKGHCISLMSTILTAAVDARHLRVNPLYGRRRTKATVQTVEDKPTPKKTDEEKWARPEIVLQVAQRLGPAVGLHVLTTAFTGLNWGEGIGLHRDQALLTRRQPHGRAWWECPILRVVQEVAEYNERDADGAKLGTVLRLEPPKNAYRERDVDVPPFLAQLLRYHLADWPHPFPFCTPNGKWWRNSNFSRRYLRPAADGRPVLEQKQGRAPREAWAPIAPGLTMRALRHTHDTYQDQIGVRPALMFEQAGHKRPGIKGVYQHPTAEMRQERLNGLQEIYERAMEALGWRTLWDRVDLVKRPAEVDLPNSSQLIYMEERSRRRMPLRGRSDAV